MEVKKIPLKLGIADMQCLCKMTEHRRVFFLCSVLFGISVFIVPPVSATNGVTLSPAMASVTVDPGRSATKTLTIVNQGKESLGVSFSVSPYGVNGIEYEPNFTKSIGSAPVEEWIRIEQAAPSELLPSKPYTVTYTVSVPTDTEPGGYYAALFVTTYSMIEQPGTIQSKGRVGELLYITVNGPVKTAVELVDSHLPGLLWRGEQVLPFEIRNTGGIHVMADANVVVKDIFGRVIHQESLQRYVLPQTTRSIVSRWDTDTQFGIYRVERHVSMLGKDHSLPTAWVLVIGPLATIISAGFLCMFGWLVWHYAHARNKGRRST
ncbi:hypothetical protein EOL96_01180 [Candidatus Saccharibacteria bacterium]|nr:hypothetical protein [Candidatus Saccharibacteria bacterium]